MEDEQSQQAQQGEPNGTAEAVDWEAKYNELKRHSREWEKLAKQRKGAADELAALKESQMSETEKLQQQLADATARADALQAEKDRKQWIGEVSTETGVPADLLELVSAADRDDLMAKAEKLADRYSATEQPTVPVVLGDGKLMPAAEDAIYGHTAGETFRFDFTYPEQFRVEELSGKTAQFEIKLHSVAEKTTPELNEEFARAQGYADLAAMREAVRAKKRKIHEDAADRAAGQELLAKAGANLTVDLPEAMLDRTADNEMRMLEQRLSRSNITLEKHCKNSHTTAAALRAGYRDAAERNLRSMLASRSIAEAENITVSTLEVNNEYRRLSQLQDTPEADIRRVLSPDTLAAALVAQKVQRFLLDNADITTVMDPEKE